MNRNEFDNLDTGDVIRNWNGEGWVVTANYGTLGVVVVRTRLIHNPREWRLVEKAQRQCCETFTEKEE